MLRGPAPNGHPCPQRRSRRIHAARPTPHRLRSACTKVAFCGVWTFCVGRSKAQQQQQQQQQHSRASSLPQGRGPVCKTASAHTGLFPAKAGPTKQPRAVSGTGGSPVGPASAGKPLILILIFKHKNPRRHQSRLGCRLNGGLVEWAEPHGCGESAVRAWMPVRRGPTERDRSEGTRRSRAQPGAQALGYLGLYQVTRRRRNSLPPGRRF